jgi:hypothetical protein
MNCFRHRHEEAIAICRQCGKAACAECCRDTAHGVACSDECARELAQMQLLTSRLKQNYGVGFKPPMPISVPTYFFFGLVLLITGLYVFISQSRIDYLTLAMAAVFFVMALGTYKRYRDSCNIC